MFRNVLCLSTNCVPMFRHVLYEGTNCVPMFRHVLVNNFKFGVVYQRVGQTTEEALFGNRNHSPAMERFLEMIGRLYSTFADLRS